MSQEVYKPITKLSQIPPNRLLMGFGVFISGFSMIFHFLFPFTVFILLFGVGLFLLGFGYWRYSQKEKLISIDKLKQRLVSDDGLRLRFKHTTGRIKVSNIQATLGYG